VQTSNELLHWMKKALT